MLLFRRSSRARYKEDDEDNEDNDDTMITMMVRIDAILYHPPPIRMPSCRTVITITPPHDGSRSHPPPIDGEPNPNRTISHYDDDDEMKMKR